tara:strand:+ start:848 stop:1105 length:258 start_codon:yes stop_codon:yes gene_type:complete
MTEAEIIWREEVIDFLGDYWELKGRPDLFNDVVDHVLNVYPENNFDDKVILGEAFAFLQTHCTSALSSADLEFMALTEKERLLTF